MIVAHTVVHSVSAVNANDCFLTRPSVNLSSLFLPFLVRATVNNNNTNKRDFWNSAEPNLAFIHIGFETEKVKFDAAL